MKDETGVYADLNLAMGNRSFLTGSRAYGTPREDSDIDMVVLIRRDLFDLLIEHGADESAEPNNYPGTIRFGKLNIVALHKLDEFEIWKQVTEDLIKEKPVTKEVAIEAFQLALFDLRNDDL